MICELLVSRSSSSNSFKTYLTVCLLIKSEQDTRPTGKSEYQFSLKLAGAYGLFVIRNVKTSPNGTAYLAVI